MRMGTELQRAMGSMSQAGLVPTPHPWEQETPGHRCSLQEDQVGLFFQHSGDRGSGDGERCEQDSMHVGDTSTWANGGSINLRSPGTHQLPLRKGSASHNSVSSPTCCSLHSTLHSATLRSDQTNE